MFVGSSRSSKSGRENSARAKAKRIRHPPENVLVARACMSLLKPKPFKMTDARAGALSASMFSSAAYTSVSFLFSVGSDEPALISALICFSSVSNRVRAKSHSSTLKGKLCEIENNRFFLLRKRCFLSKEKQGVVTWPKQ